MARQVKETGADRPSPAGQTCCFFYNDLGYYSSYCLIGSSFAD